MWEVKPVGRVVGGKEAGRVVYGFTSNTCTTPAFITALHARGPLLYLQVSTGEDLRLTMRGDVQIGIISVLDHTPSPSRKLHTGRGSVWHADLSRHPVQLTTITQTSTALVFGGEKKKSTVFALWVSLRFKATSPGAAVLSGAFTVDGEALATFSLNGGSQAQSSDSTVRP